MTDLATLNTLNFLFPELSFFPIFPHTPDY